MVNLVTSTAPIFRISNNKPSNQIAAGDNTRLTYHAVVCESTQKKANNCLPSLNKNQDPETRPWTLPSYPHQKVASKKQLGNIPSTQVRSSFKEEIPSVCTDVIDIQP